MVTRTGSADQPTVGATVDREMIAGDDEVWRHNVTVSGATVAEALLVFFARSADTSLLWKYIDGTPQPDGEIEDDGAGGTAILRFDLTAAETALLGTAWRDHIVRVTLDDGRDVTIESGDFRAERTRAPDAPVQDTAP